MEIDRNKLIGERVRFYRTANDMGLDALAISLPVAMTSAAMLSRYETGASRWPADLLAAVAMVLRVDIRLLIGLEDGKHEGKENHEWEAEKYKIVILSLPDRFREVCYKIIDAISKLSNTPIG